MRNRFKELSSVVVNDHIEEKNGLKYLSWAWAWQIFKENFPDSKYTIYESSSGLNYFTDGKTCYVKTGVTLVDGDYELEHIEMLPVMDFKNKSIPLESLTSYDVNKAIQRSLTKAIARHGLGCYIYAGEDLPEAAKDDIADLLKEIQPLVIEITKGMTADQKRDFAKTHIVPYIGGADYNKCKDVTKLNAFIDHLKTMKG